MNKISALLFAYNIITEKRNEKRYASTQLKNKKGDTTATYNDAVSAIARVYNEVVEQELRERSTIQSEKIT